MWNTRRSDRNNDQPVSFSSSADDSYAQRDRARLIHSSAFRRLQSKTQVLSIGENDFYRTRLTHSLEVAQIGSGICEQLKQRYASTPEYMQWIPSLSQIEAICLAHDIGHPPFGHGGEVALNFHMHNQGGFEGNGQTLRIVSRLGEYSQGSGLNLTRRTMLGLLKYPVLHHEVASYQLPANTGTTNIDAYKPPKCIHDDEVDILHWILYSLPDSDVTEFRKVQLIKGKKKATFKAFDTSIMELADDISYGVHDLEDALALGFITTPVWQEEVLNKLDGDDVISKDRDFYQSHLFSDSNKDRKYAISKLVRYFIHEISIERQHIFETPLLDMKASMSDDAERTLNILKNLVFKHVIKRPEVQTLEYKGQQLILRIFEVLQDNPSRLLPSTTYEKYSHADNKNRVICDYISGMTDSYATKLYHKLFTPDMGSIFDRM